jgi:hypothetical protein
MKKGLILGIIAVIIIILIGGYFLFINEQNVNNSNSQAGSSTKPKISNKDPSDLALQLSDLPQEYSIKDRAPRVTSDVSDEGLNWGWKKGYYITFMKGGESLLDYSVIEQTISIYPVENISRTLSEPENDENTTYEKIDIEKIGDNSVAHKITTKNEFLGDIVNYEVEFTKKDVYDQFVSGGAENDFELLKELAKKAEGKI